jgi:hypothetical protein
MLVCLVPGGAGLAVPQPVPEPPSETLVVFRSWISLLEARNLPASSWEYPFAAPRPGELSDTELATVLELRRLARSGNKAHLEAAIDRAVRQNTDPAPQIQFWLACGLHRVGRPEAGLPRLADLLQDPRTPAGLDGGQFVWVMTSLADGQFLFGDRGLARDLYESMAASSVSHLHLWGNYQLAGSDFLDRDFAAADRRYELVCDQENTESWREHACEMAAIASRLAQPGTEGTDHGMAANVAR